MTKKKKQKNNCIYQITYSTDGYDNYSHFCRNIDTSDTERIVLSDFIKFDNYKLPLLKVGNVNYECEMVSLLQTDVIMISKFKNIGELKSNLTVINNDL